MENKKYKCHIKIMTFVSYCVSTNVRIHGYITETTESRCVRQTALTQSENDKQHCEKQRYTHQESILHMGGEWRQTSIHTDTLLFYRFVL